MRLSGYSNRPSSKFARALHSAVRALLFKHITPKYLAGGKTVYHEVCSLFDAHLNCCVSSAHRYVSEMPPTPQQYEAVAGTEGKVRRTFPKELDASRDLKAFKDVFTSNMATFGKLYPLFFGTAHALKEK